MPDRHAKKRLHAIFLVVIAIPISVACSLDVPDERLADDITVRRGAGGAPRDAAAPEAAAAAPSSAPVLASTASDAALPSPATDGGGGAAAGCCSGKGLCVPAAAIPEERKASLEADTCAAGTLCAPREALSPTFVPAACTASIAILKTPGVCLSSCLSFGELSSFVRQADCDADHVCVPCEAFGQATGAPGCR